jgi:hypothetical protein
MLFEWQICVEKSAEFSSIGLPLLFIILGAENVRSANG